MNVETKIIDKKTIRKNNDTKRESLLDEYYKNELNKELSQVKYFPNNKKLNIAIVGGGLAGLAVGISLLQLRFVNVTIYERDNSLESRRQGYGLTILQGITALKRLGVYDSVKNIDVPSRSHYIFKYDGSIIGFFGTLFWASSISCKKAKKHNLHIGRQQLRGILLEKYVNLHPLGLKGIEWNKRPSFLNKLNKTISFMESNIETNPIDMLIGCDGIKSYVRKWKYSMDADLEYLGIIIVLGITKTDGHFLGHQRVFQTVDGYARIFVMPYPDVDAKIKGDGDTIMWQLSFPLPEEEAQAISRDIIKLKDYAMNMCIKWHAPIPDIIKSTSYELLMGIPAYDRDLEKFFQEESYPIPIALLGDAAHPMSPFKGQGANQALLDAVSLVDKISSSLQCFYENKILTSDKSIYNCLKEAVTEYENEMLKRVSLKVKESRERVYSFHNRDALSTNSYLYRGVDSNIISELNINGINAFYSVLNKSFEESIQAILNGKQKTPNE